MIFSSEMTSDLDLSELLSSIRQLFYQFTYGILEYLKYFLILLFSLSEVIFVKNLRHCEKDIVILYTELITRQLIINIILILLCLPNTHKNSFSFIMLINSPSEY